MQKKSDAPTWSVETLASLLKIPFEGDGDRSITGIDALESATPSDASFFENPRYKVALQHTHAGVVCIDPKADRPCGKNYLLTPNPSKVFQALIELFLQASPPPFHGIHPTAVIHPTVVLGQGVTLGPYVVIDAHSSVGDHTRIEAGTLISSEVTIGQACHFYPGAIVREKTVIGNRVILQSGAVIGSCGFGYHTDALGRHTKLEQLGRVVIEDDVEIGANTTIDRARFKETRIRKGTKIDNLVQIGHNVEIGEYNFIVAQVGISGSVKTGSHVMLGGQVGVAGHIEIAPQVMVAAKSGVTKSVTEPGKYNGTPLQPLHEYNRQQVLLRRIEDYEQRLKALEKRLQGKSTHSNS